MEIIELKQTGSDTTPLRYHPVDSSQLCGIYRLLGEKSTYFDLKSTYFDLNTSNFDIY